jgi:hypothetical protein
MKEAPRLIRFNGLTVRARHPPAASHLMSEMGQRRRFTQSVTIQHAGPPRQPISQKSASSRVASLKITISSASRAGVT